MLVDIEPWLWDENDLDVEFIMPFWDVREAIHVDDNFGTRYDNNTIASTGNDFGSNLVLNDTDTQRFHLIVNGDDDDIYRVKLTGIRCLDGCPIDVPDIVPVENRTRYWSKLEDWDGRAELPQDGDEIIIPEEWTMIYDLPVEDAPKLLSLEVNGKLSFEHGADRMIKAYNFWVRGGELNIGDPKNPFIEEATIELQGDNTEHYWAFVNNIEAGNKNLVVTGTVNMYGKPRDLRSRLQSTVYAGQRDIYVE